MGHIFVHASVSGFVSTELKKVVPTELIPPNSYIYLELGNFLTDISQVRDPASYMRAKPDIFRTVVEKAIPRVGGVPLLSVPLALGAGSKSFADDLLGKPEKDKRHGAVAQFFQHVALLLTHFFFASNSVIHTMAQAAQPVSQGGELGESFSSILQEFGGLDPKEVDRVFRCAFTQYYPHEHLDFPPIKDGANHRSKKSFQRLRRGLIGYLEENIQFLSEELSKLEVEWLKGGSQSLAQEHIRNDLFARLGHLLHVIEDFYFHSNFLEIWQWERLRRFDPGADPNTPAGYDRLMNNSLRGTQYTPTLVRLRRCLNRRLRYPVYSEGIKPDESLSLDATNLVYTGGFGETDMMHTISGGLEAIEEAGVGPVFTSDSQEQERGLILLRLLFKEDERRMMVRERLTEKHIQTHLQQLDERQYRPWIKRRLERGLLTRRMAEELEKAFELDRAFEKKYSHLPGVGGFLIAFLDRMQTTIIKSEHIEKSLDQDWQSILRKATFNKASAETIGTHSLMAKDSSKKEPFHAEAKALAKHASASVATTFLRRIGSDSSQTKGIDWDSVVRYFLRFPGVQKERWENQVLLRFQATGKQPALSEIKDQPTFRLLSPDFQKEKLAARRAGKKKSSLEQRYQSLER